MIKDLEKVVDTMRNSYVNDGTIVDKQISFNVEEKNLITQYKNNLSIYFLVPDMNGIQKDEFSELYSVSVFAFEMRMKERMKRCIKGNISYQELHYTKKNITRKKLANIDNTTFLVDMYGDRIIWGWNHIQNYTELIWDPIYQKQIILPIMKKANKVIIKK